MGRAKWQSWWIALALALAASNSVYALDPTRAATQYGLQTWTARTGLPGEAVYRIDQTSDGYIWLRTNTGVNRFDGVRFVPLELRVEGKLIREVPKAFCRRGDRTLLVRTKTRTLCYEDGLLTDVLEPASAPSGVARSLFETRAGRIWVGSDCALHTARGRDLVEALQGTGLVYAFLEDRRGNLWIGASAGLFEFRGDTLVKPARDFAPIADVRSLIEDREGNLWVGTSGGLYQLTDGRSPEYIVAPELAGRSISTILQDRDGCMWVGTTTSGLLQRAGSRWQTLTSAGGLTSNAILSLHEDREGSLWVGTDSGLHQLRDTNFVSITAMEGLPDNDTYAVMEARDGSVYVSSASGLARIRDGAVTSYTTKDGLPRDYCTALYEARDGTIWVGTGGGLASLDAGGIHSYTGDGALKDPCISVISEDANGLIVGTTGTPPLRLRRKSASEGGPGAVTFEVDPRTQGLPYLFTICKGTNGTLWYGTVDGLYRAAGSAPTTLSKDPKITFPVTSIADDARGYLWLAGRSPGVTRYRLQDGQVTQYTTTEGLFDDDLTCVGCDVSGDLWASTARGIFRVSRQDLDDVADGRARAVRSVAFGTADGMRTTESVVAERQPGCCHGRDGRMWFTTRKGVVVVNPGRMLANEQVPPVIIEDLVADGKRFSGRSEARLVPGNNRLEFFFTGLSLRVPERVRFRYRLEGFDSEWIDAGNQRVAHYTNLPPGDYTFRVSACNDDGVWNTSGASMEVHLAPWFYQTSSFLMVCLTIAFSTVGGFVALRHASGLARERELARRVDQATAELRESEERYRHLFYSNPNPMWVIDGETHAFQAVNDAAVAHYGYSSEEFLGMKEIEIVAPDDMPSFVARVAEDGRSHRHPSARWRHRTKDGTIIDVEVTSRTIAFAGRAAHIVLAQDITERKRAALQLEYQASHDALTGLANRACLLEHLDRMIVSSRRSGASFALLLVDLDRFKEINDTLGHAYGDMVLRQVSARFGAALRESDILARLGGDEFAVLLPGTDSRGALQSAGRLHNALTEPFVLEGQNFDVGASIGISSFSEHGDDPDELLRLADVAMYSAKRSRSGSVIYSLEPNSHAPCRLAQARELRQGIANAEMVLHYQPILDLATGRAQRVEALIRWEHPRDGLLSPAQFLPMVVNSGLIKPLSRWVLDAALVQSRVWRRSGLELGIAVNLTPMDVKDRALIATIRQLLESTDACGSSLTVEVPESAVLEDPGRVRAVLSEFRSLGIKVAIDDFGVSHSSLEQLKDLPVDELKIDRSFVKDLSSGPGAAMIIRSITERGHELGLRVVAEGVEDQGALDQLRALGCDQVQGYFICRPMPPDPFAEWARQSGRRWTAEPAQSLRRVCGPRASVPRTSS